MNVARRSEKVAFYGIKGETDTVTYHRMEGFTDITTSKNPKEYTRQYVDMDTEITDITGYSTSMDYSFDWIKGNAVHEDLIAITDGELVGADAVRSIIVVDMASATHVAKKRDFTVVPDSEGDTTDAYTYSGSLRAYGEVVDGTATSADGRQTITFTEADGE